MTEMIPYFAGFITILFGIGFYLGVRDVRNDVIKNRYATRKEMDV